MTSFHPVSLAETLEILSNETVTPVAGGTDLMVRHRRHGALPLRLETAPVFVARLDEIRSIELLGGTLRVGAAVTLAELLAHVHVAEGLKMALREFASPAIRNSGTIAGNICNASPAADTLPYLYACDAEVEIASVRGRRNLPIRDFVTGPGSTAREPDELVTAILMPAAETGYAYYRKVAPRKSNALSKLSVYVEASIGDGVLDRFHAAMGAVAPTVIRDPDAEEALIGNTLEDLPRFADDFVRRISDLVHPISDQRSTAVYRRNTALRIIRHVLEQDLPSWRHHD